MKKQSFLLFFSIALFLCFFSLSAFAENRAGQELTPEKLEQIKGYSDTFNYIVFSLIGISLVLLGIRGLMGKSPELNRSFVKRVQRIIASLIFIILGFSIIYVLFADDILYALLEVICLIGIVMALVSIFIILNHLLKGRTITQPLKHESSDLPEFGDYHLLKFRENAKRLEIIVLPSILTYLYFWITSIALWWFGMIILGVSGMETIARIIVNSDSPLEFILGIIVSIQSGSLFTFLLGALLILLSIGALLAGILKLFIKIACVFDKRKKMFCFFYQRYRPFRVCHEIEEIRSFRIFTEKTSRRVHGNYLNKTVYATTKNAEHSYYLHVQLMSGGCPALFQVPFFDRIELEKAEARIKQFIDWDNMNFLSVSRK